MSENPSSTAAIIGKYISVNILKNPKKVIKPTDSLITSGMIDSFSLVDVQAFIEQEFGVWIEDPEMTVTTCETLEKIALLVESRKEPPQL